MISHDCLLQIFAILSVASHDSVIILIRPDVYQVILDEAIVKLDPDFFWLGGGEVDLKLGIRTSEFISSLKPFIVNCSGS